MKKRIHLGKPFLEVPMQIRHSEDRTREWYSVEKCPLELYGSVCAYFGTRLNHSARCQRFVGIKFENGQFVSLCKGE